MEHDRVCPVCGRKFTATDKKIVYCGAECRTTARRKRDAAAHRAKRAEGAKERNRIRVERAQEREARADASKRKFIEDFEARCNAGDPSALMLDAKAAGGNMSADYWRHFAQVEMLQAESNGTTAKTLVNGFSVYEDEFEEKIIESIAAHGHITITMLNGRRQPATAPPEIHID